MHTLISAFENRGSARRAVEGLLQAGFARDDVHLREDTITPTAGAEGDADEREIGERTMDSAEREVAVDRGVLSSLGHFFVSAFGKDHHSRQHADAYAQSLIRGSSIIVADAQDEAQAERGAQLLAQLGASRVNIIPRDSQPPAREILGRASAGEE